MFKKTVKLLLIGDSSVGKSAILNSYCGEEFKVNFMPTIGIDFKVKTIKKKGENIKLQIWDTAGQERFRAITASYYRGASGVMVVYDVTDWESFRNAQTWLENVYEIPKILVGNKSDLGAHRKISREEGEELAGKYRAPFYETSAKTGENIQKAFDTLIAIANDREIPMRTPEESPKNVCC